jgi:hypothetical protein
MQRVLAWRPINEVRVRGVVALEDAADSLLLVLIERSAPHWLQSHRSTVNPCSWTLEGLACTSVVMGCTTLPAAALLVLAAEAGRPLPPAALSPTLPSTVAGCRKRGVRAMAECRKLKTEREMRNLTSTRWPVMKARWKSLWNFKWTCEREQRAL